MEEIIERIPDEVLNIIEAELKRQVEAQQAKAQAEEAIRKVNVEKGWSLLDKFVQTCKSAVPEWVLAYFHVVNVDEDELERAGRENHVGYINASCMLKIPGLAPIKVVMITIQDGQRVGYQVPGAQEPEYGAPEYWWNGNYRYDTHLLDDALLIAMRQGQRFAGLTKKYQAHCQDCQQREEAQKLEEQIENAQIQEKIAEENKEAERILFDFINDPVAIHMLKAFYALRQERNAYQDHIRDMDDAITDASDFWSRKAAEYRHQAEEAERRAADERSRADDLSNELGDAQRENKKLQRGW